jgi:hypothetical protein
MPNHVTTVCTVTGPTEDVAAFVAAHIRENEWRGEKRREFDFDTIIPMPQSIKDTERPFQGTPGMEDPRIPPEARAGCGDAQVEMYALSLLHYRKERHDYTSYSWLPADVQTWGQLRTWLESTSPAAAFWAKRMLLAAADTGYPGWYEWSIANWGTKWGAYQYKERDTLPNVFVFEFQTAWNVPVPIFNKLASMYPALVFQLVSIDEGGPEYEGSFGHGTCDFERKPDDAERYKRVYGRYPDPPEEDEDSSEENRPS